MGLLDIFYSEMNRWRNKLGSEKEKQEVIKRALKKTLKKFKIIWEDQILNNVYNNNQKRELFEEFSENFLDIAVEVDETLKDKEIVNNLREMSKQFRQVANSSNLNFDVVCLGLGQLLNRTNEIDKKLKK